MSSVNKALIIGRLGQDPDVRYTASGNAITNLSVATSHKCTDKETGGIKQQTEWHKVSIFGRTAEVAGEYLRKGSQVYVEGRLQTRKWTDKEGVERYATEIVGEQLTMLGGAPDKEDKPAKPQSNAKQYANAKSGRPAQSIADLDENIPF